jgi:DNA polymerase-3 subunit alpha
MAAKMSIKDVARVMDLPLQDSNLLAKMVPERPGIELNFILKAAMDGEGGVKDKYSLAPEEVETVKQLRDILQGSDLRAKVLKEALKLEGSVRGTGIHAAGIIIAPKDLKEIIPVATAKDSDLLVTQFDGRVIEDAGVIKMDFLGLKTLTILRDALLMIKTNHGIDIDLDTLPLDDAKTFALYQKAETNGTFQFESVGMQKHLKDLKPDKFDDLVAMNALFRPGPIQYIPSFIARKHGKEEISYDLTVMEEYLSDTYGITVYQEQVMLLSQKIGGFTKGDADVLRKAMGKKQKDVLDKMKGKFITGAIEKGHDAKVLEKVWTDWEAFAQYAFNKSHSVCYALVAYQTGYLKAHYPAEYMAAVLSNNMSNIDKITFFMEECRRMGVSVLGPDVNESDVKFTVNKKGQIRFAMSAIKGIGEGIVQEIVKERESGGPFTSIFDLTKRLSQRTLNVKALETLAYAGALDGFEGIHRAQYFHVMRDNTTIIEKAVKFGQLYNQQKGMATISLFGDSADSELQEPEIPAAEPWDEFYKLQKEKEVISIYLSGHPLDTFEYECKYFANAQLTDIVDTENVDASVAVLVTDVKKLVTNNGRPFARINVEDKTGNMEINFYGEDYNKYLAFLEQGARLLISGGFKKAFKDSDRLNYKVNQIQFMQDLMGNKIKEIKLMTNVKSIDEKWVDQLMNILTDKKNKGNVPLKILVYEEKIKEVTLNSRGISLAPGKELFDSLTGLPFTQLKLEMK